jgi:hypothetical protein
VALKSLPADIFSSLRLKFDASIAGESTAEQLILND